MTNSENKKNFNDESFSELKIKLMVFLKKNVPLVALNCDYFVIFRLQKMIVVKGSDLRIGDIRLLQLPAVDLVKGLSEEQWNHYVRTFRTLMGSSSFVL